MPAKKETKQAEIETETVSNVVKMEDGSEIDFGKRAIIKREIEVSGEGKNRKAVIHFNLRNGKQFTKTVTADDPLLFELAAHGTSAKIGDAAAGCAVDDAALAVEQTLKLLAEGKWSNRKPAAAKGMSDFLEALCTVKGATTDEEKRALRQKVMALPEEAQKTLKSLESVQAEIAKIRAARAAKIAEEKAAKAAEAGSEAEDALAKL